MLVRTRAPVAVVVLTLIAGCDSPTTCTGVCMGNGAVEIACPSDVTVSGVPAGGQTVTYSSPTTTGGTPPVTTTCVPASGSVFPVGTTTVGCSAHDAINRSAVCSFHVTLSSSHLGALHFLAFGDSTTAGENGIDFPGDTFPEMFTPAPCGTTSLQSAGRVFDSRQAQPQFFDPAVSYPPQLLNLLKARFTGETFSMENEGNPGEEAAAGVNRLGDCFQTGDRPDAMLLLEGINDIALSMMNYQPNLSEQQAIIDDLKKDVSNAINAGVTYIFVSTILPVGECYVGPDQPQPCRVGNVGDPSVPALANNSIDQVNAMIRANVGGATIVDGNAAFKAADPTFATLIEEDGLHPTPAGYAVLAQAWMNAIVSHIPVTSLRRRR